MLRIALCCATLVGCGAGGAAAPPAQPVVASVAAISPAQAEQQRRMKLAAAHRELEAEQSAALAATCEKSDPPAPHSRCEPSCYRAEPADPRAGKQLGRAEIVHLACRSADAAETGPIVFADEIGGALRAARGRMPKLHLKGSWEAEVEAAVGAALQPELSRGDVIRVTGAWTLITHPVTKERLRCVAVSHHVAAIRRPLDGCGGRGAIACEVTGNAAVHGINVVHYRLAEARQFHTIGLEPECQQAALEAIAVARGLPRWRQYVTLNVNQWKAYPRYRTRFDGILDEDTLFATAASLGRDAEALHVECGGASGRTTAAQEQSFHTCW